ncbi:leucine-rich repeat domain-containing protein [bacterium]|nr:leucine-rich repeat domain-containing protein [bacterium]
MKKNARLAKPLLFYFATLTIAFLCTQYTLGVMSPDCSSSSSSDSNSIKLEPLDLDLVTLDNGKLWIIKQEATFNEFIKRLKQGMRPDATSNEKKFFEEANEVTELHCVTCKSDVFPIEICALENLKRLHLEVNQFPCIPKEIGNLKNLVSLELPCNQLSSIPAEIGLLKKLHTLCLDYNQLTTLPPEIGDLESLVKLDLVENKKIAFPKEIKFLKKLEEFNVSYCDLVQFPSAMCGLQNLRELKMGNNKIKLLPQKIGTLKNLKIFKIDRNELSQLPQEIWDLENLQTLDLEQNKLTHIPAPTKYHKSLSNLVLTSNKLKSLPDDIELFTNLHTLRLEFNCLTYLPRNIGKLKNLRDLITGYNQLTELPKSIGNLENLHTLLLCKNPMVTLPWEISKLSNLKRLELHGFPWQYIPPQLRHMPAVFKKDPFATPREDQNESPFSDYALCDEPKIHKPNKSGLLRFGHPTSAKWFLAKLCHDPDFLGQMREQVKTIMLNNFLNGINFPQITLKNLIDEKCTKEMYCLECTSEAQAVLVQIELMLFNGCREEVERIQVLDLSRLGLEELSPAIKYFKNLERLFLNENQLYSLPEEVGKLKQLTFLNLAANELKTLPKSLETLENLGTILLDDNPLDGHNALPHLEDSPAMKIISGDGDVLTRLCNQCKEAKFPQLLKLLELNLLKETDKPRQTKESMKKLKIKN